MRYITTRSAIAFVMAVFLLIFVWIFVAGIDDFSAAAETEQLETMANMIKRAAIQCYALEGGFPPDIEYLSNYGVSFNYDKFVYNYNVIGSNVMPEISVEAKER